MCCERDRIAGWLDEIPFFPLLAPGSRATQRKVLAQPLVDWPSTLEHNALRENSFRLPDRVLGTAEHQNARKSPDRSHAW
jgi:hypothetical protein